MAKDFGVLDILHVEHEVFGPAHLAGKADVVPGEDVAAVELVPEHAVKIRSGLVHQAEGEYEDAVKEGVKFEWKTTIEAFLKGKNGRLGSCVLNTPEGERVEKFGL